MTLPRLTRLAQIVLVVNAVMATIAALALAFGFAPFAAEQPVMARRAAAGEFAGAVILAIIATRLPRDPSLINVAIAFVACQLLSSGYEWFKHGTTGALVPFLMEAAALSFYIIFSITVLRARRS